MNMTDIIAAFGGVRPMSRETGIPATTISHWSREGCIGGRRTMQQMARVLAAAKAHGLQVSCEDLVQMAGPPDPEVRA